MQHMGRADVAVTRMLATVMTCVVVAACGSTVQLDGVGGDQAAAMADGARGQTITEDGMALGPAGDGLTDVPLAGGSAVRGSAGATGGSSAATSAATVGGTPGGTTSSGTSPGSRRPAAVPDPKTPTEIKIGFFVTENSDAAYEAAGIEAFSRGNQRDYLRIVVDDLNATGGIGGRKVVPVVHVQDSMNGNTSEQNAQAACATWTEDNDVFAVAMDSGFVRATLRACLEKRGVPLITSGVSLVDTHTYRQAPHYVEIAGLPADRLAAAQVPALHANRYFTAGPTGMRIGLLRLETPEYDRASNEAMKPALRSLGLRLADEVAIPPAGSQAGFGDFVAQIGAAVLRFKSKDITHVLFLEPGGGLAYFFMNSAEGQAYRPRYGLHSQNGGQALLGNGEVSAEQLRDSVGIGYLPATDVRMGDRQDTAGGRRCLKLLRREGQVPADAGAVSVAFVFCDTARYLQAAAAAAPGVLTTDSIIRGAESLGGSFSSGYTHAVKFGPNRHYGAAGYRTVGFFPDCTCFKYTSGLQALR